MLIVNFLFSNKGLSYQNWKSFNLSELLCFYIKQRNKVIHNLNQQIYLKNFESKCSRTNFSNEQQFRLQKIDLIY